MTRTDSQAQQIQEGICDYALRASYLDERERKATL